MRLTIHEDLPHNCWDRMRAKICTTGCCSSICRSIRRRVIVQRPALEITCRTPAIGEGQRKHGDFTRETGAVRAEHITRLRNA